MKEDIIKNIMNAPELSIKLNQNMEQKFCNIIPTYFKYLRAIECFLKEDYENYDDKNIRYAEMFFSLLEQFYDKIPEYYLDSVEPDNKNTIRQRIKDVKQKFIPFYIKFLERQKILYQNKLKNNNN